MSTCVCDREYYPDSYDVTVKMQSKLFASISPILELARQQQCMSAAEVMVLVITSIINSQLCTVHFSLHFSLEAQLAVLLYTASCASLFVSLVPQFLNEHSLPIIPCHTGPVLMA